MSVEKEDEGKMIAFFLFSVKNTNYSRTLYYIGEVQRGEEKNHLQCLDFLFCCSNVVGKNLQGGE